MIRIYYNPSPDKRVEHFNALIQENFPEFLTETDPEVILVAGGDGAMHHATKKFPNFTGVYFGKALGTFNFLMNDFDSDVSTLKQLQSASLAFHIVETATIKASVNGKFLGLAANDILLGESVNGYHHFSIDTKDSSFDDFSVKGTGICISTPLGSTAYNFNNGGVILPLDSNLWSLTGIVCNKLINDVVTSQEMTITANEGKVFIDGIDVFSMKVGDTLLLEPGSNIRLGFIDKHQFMRKRIDLSHRMRKNVV